MSMQQVNLYLPGLRPKKEWLTANSIALSTLGFVCIMMLAVFFLKRGLAEYERRVVSLENYTESSKQRVKGFHEKTRPTSSLSFDRKLTELKKSIAAREQIGQIIQGQNLGNEFGFSTHFQGLARQALSSISLQHIKISRGGKFVELTGLTQSTQDVPLYMQNLRSENSFRGSQFGLLSVSSNPSIKNVHRFAFGFDSVYQVATGDVTP